MDLLLDTHTFLWFVLNDAKLSRAALAAVLDPMNRKHVSPASYWEVAIKVSKRKYRLTVPHATFFETGIVHNGFTVVPIEPRHTAVVETLPFRHNDPFDRLIIAQALVEDMPVVSIDAQFDSYGVRRIW